jgi:hypothetical protein
VSADQYEDFLLSVVNAAERSGDADLRGYFVRRYGNWFPPYQKHQLKAHEWYYHEVRAWWKTSLRDLPEEDPDDHFGLHATILRHKLRVIWLLASSGNQPEAANRITQMVTAYYRRYHLALEARDQEWGRERLLGACQWLGGQLDKMRECANPTCQQIRRYFLRVHNNDKYCSRECTQEAHDLRHAQRSKHLPQKPFKRSKLSRDKMSESAKRRWAKWREERGREE